MQDVDIIEINDDQAYNAKLLASGLSTSPIRKRGMIDMLGINCAINYFYSKKIKVSTQRSVYKIPLLFEEFKITDVYFGNYRIDIITLYKEKNIKIPKIHVDMDIMPNFYFVVQIGSKIQEAKMIGFIEAKGILACSHDSKFYYPTLNLIFDIERFRELTKRSITSKTMLGKHVDCMGLFLKFIDNDLSSIYKRQLIQHLMNCDSCRTRFIDTMDFEKLSNNIRFYPDLIRKTETIKQVPYVEFENSSNSKFTNFEEGIKKVEVREVENNLSKEDFIQIDKKDNSSDSAKRNATVEMFDLYEGLNKKQLNKNVIDNIFKDIPKIELASIKQIMTSKNRRMILSFIAVLFVISSFALISYKGSSDTITNEESDFEQVQEFNNSDFQDDFDISNYNQAPPAPIGENYSIKQQVSAKASYAPSVSKISWEVTQDLLQNEAYSNFLKSVGKNVKLNLQNDLLLVSDNPMSKYAKVDIKITGSGDVKSVDIVASSGSRIIDNSILKVVNETLKYMKPPTLGILSKASVATLVVELK